MSQKIIAALAALAAKITGITTIEEGVAALVDGLRQQIETLTTDNQALHDQLAAILAADDADATQLETLAAQLDASNQAAVALNSLLQSSTPALANAVAANVTPPTPPAATTEPATETTGSTQATS